MEEQGSCLIYVNKLHPHRCDDIGCRVMTPWGIITPHSPSSSLSSPHSPSLSCLISFLYHPYMLSFLYIGFLTLGAHAQRGLRYLVCPSLSVCLSVCYRVFCHHAQQASKIATSTGSALHRLHFLNGHFRKSAAFRSYGLKTK